MALSAVLAYAYPFQLFLFVYAFLGPLHYLTEISWLHDRGYYTQRKRDALLMVVLSFVMTGLFLKVISPGASSGDPLGVLCCFAFFASLFIAFFKNPMARWSGVLVAGLAAFLFKDSGFFSQLGVFFPTLIHVFFFTGLFLLSGVLKGKNLSGWLALLAFGGLGVSFIFFHPAHPGFASGDPLLNNYGYVKEDGETTSPFITLNFMTARLLNMGNFAAIHNSHDLIARVNSYLYQDPAAQALMSFIAFAYTYHYFNWFSKTSVIRWHEVPRLRLAGVLTVWLFSIGLYAANYSAGVKWLFFLSLTHVLLEFPLNQLTILNIYREVRGRLFPKALLPGQAGIKT